VSVVDEIIHELVYGTVEDALTLDLKAITSTAVIGGVQTDVSDIRADHGTGQPVGTCELTIPAPVPGWVKLGASVHVEAGYGSAVGTIFDGRIPDDSAAMSETGGDVTLNAVGWASLLASPARRDIIFPAGSTNLKTIFESLCRLRGVRMYRSDLTISPSGATLNLGGVTEVDGGKVIVKAGTSLLDWLNRVGDLFGYSVFDTPNGTIRLARILSAPTSGQIVIDYVEGENVVTHQRDRRASDIINDWDIHGAKYTAADTSQVAVRSFTAVVPNNPLLAPLGYRHGDLSDDILVTPALANAAREAQEVRAGDLASAWTWTAEGHPLLQPGDGVTIRSFSYDELYVPNPVWLTSLHQTVSEEAYWADMGGWAGQGTAGAAGNDSLTIALLDSAGRHLGNEYLSNYKRKNPDGTLLKFPFTVPDAYSGMTVRGFSHGANSFVGGVDSTASKFEVWQGGTDPVGSGELPRQTESLTIDFTNLSRWSPITIPLSGSLTAGSAEFRIIAGEDTSVGDVDDFECRDIVIILTGVGVGVYPTEAT